MSKLIISILTILSILVGSIYAIDDRYITSAEAASSLSIFNLKMEQDIAKIKIQILELRKSGIITEYYKHKELMRAYPEDKSLIVDFKEIKQRKKVVDEEIRLATELGG